MYNCSPVSISLAGASPFKTFIGTNSGTVTSNPVGVVLVVEPQAAFTYLVSPISIAPVNGFLLIVAEVSIDDE